MRLKSVKFALRVVLALLLVVPSYPIIFAGVSLMGMAVVIGVYRDWETDRKSTRLNSSH